MYYTYWNTFFLLQCLMLVYVYMPWIGMHLHYTFSICMIYLQYIQSRDSDARHARLINPYLSLNNIRPHGADDHTDDSCSPLYSFFYLNFKCAFNSKLLGERKKLCSLISIRGLQLNGSYIFHIFLSILYLTSGVGLE